MLFVECKLSGNVNIGYAVAIGKTESLFVTHIIGNALEATAGQRIVAGIHQT